jgi:hypothetical protein
MNRVIGTIFGLLLFSTALQAQVEVAPSPRRVVPPGPIPADVNSFLQVAGYPALKVTELYDADRGSLARTYFVAASPIRLQRFQQFYADWLSALANLKQASYSEDSREVLKQLQERIKRDQLNLLSEAAKRKAVQGLIPFAGKIVALEDSRRTLEPFEPKALAGNINQLAKLVKQTRQKVNESLQSEEGKENPDFAPPHLRYTITQLQALNQHLKTWFDFYNAYDPLFSWWLAEPYKELSSSLVEYQEMLKKVVYSKPEMEWKIQPLPPSKLQSTANYPDLATLLKTPVGRMEHVLQRYSADRGGRRNSGGVSERTKSWLAGLAQVEFNKLSQADQVDYLLLKNQLLKEQLRSELSEKKLPTPPPPRDASGIGGRPIGAEALALELRLEMVPYQASELIALAEEEYEWCLKEMKAASREMGFGDDWKAAMEKIKLTAVDPGQQPKMVRDLALEAIDYVKKHQLVTVTPLAAETWRMTMMSPQQQLYSPFFLGGETIIVAYPTSTMSHDAKLQSMRGNNPHFSRATVQHELIPGHHLQGFQSDRYATHRDLFRTPLWPEGMAVYWEMVLYDRGFPRGPEDRIGMMFWRMHRCARVIFSFGYHTGKMTPQECIDFLVEKAGHERDNATAEVRRSFTGGYGPLYQAAYQIGAMQFRALRKELVDSGRMSEKDYHDAIYQQGSIPVEMIRAILTKQPLTADFKSHWRFAEPKSKKVP